MDMRRGKMNLTGGDDGGRFVEVNEENMEKRINQLVGRHIAKCLDDLADSIAPSQQRTIKHWFWSLSDDIKLAVRGEQDDQDDYRYNR